MPAPAGRHRGHGTRLTLRLLHLPRPSAVRPTSWLRYPPPHRPPRGHEVAFEDQTMPAETCSRRLNELEAQLRDRRSREAELEAVAAVRPQFEVTEQLAERRLRRASSAVRQGDLRRRPASREWKAGDSTSEPTCARPAGSPGLCSATKDEPEVGRIKPKSRRRASNPLPQPWQGCALPRRPSKTWSNSVGAVFH
jgi:hypothetical protein